MNSGTKRKDRILRRVRLIKIKLKAPAATLCLDANQLYREAPASVPMSWSRNAPEILFRGDEAAGELWRDPT
jgi:hypothetical protein